MKMFKGSWTTSGSTRIGRNSFINHNIFSFKDEINEDVNNIKSISKMLIHETNAQLKVFETKLYKLQVPELEKFDEKVMFMEQEIINIKNM
jgi:ribosomal 50S subunit-associated protein YjgA (DUF615 family)